MRVALSLSGKRGYNAGREGLGEKLDLSIMYNHLKIHLLNRYSTDIFIHSWDQIEHEYLKNLFKPVAIKTEAQKYFGLDTNDLKNIINYSTGLGAEFRSFSKMTSFITSLDMVVDYEKKNNFNYDFIICLRLDAVLLKNLKLQKLSRNKIYVQPKVYHNHKVNLNFRKNHHHSSFIFVLNSNHLKKSNYLDLYKFNFNQKKNKFQKIRPIRNLELIEQMIFRDCVIEPTLPLMLTNLMRRVYFGKETMLENGYSKKFNYLDKKHFDYNNYIYETFYKKKNQINYFIILKYLPIILKKKLNCLYSKLYLLQHSIKNKIKKILPIRILKIVQKKNNF